MKENFGYDNKYYLEENMIILNYYASKIKQTSISCSEFSSWCCALFNYISRGGEESKSLHFAKLIVKAPVYCNRPYEWESYHKNYDRVQAIIEKSENSEYALIREFKRVTERIL